MFTTRQDKQSTKMSSTDNTFHHGLKNAILHLFRLIQLLYFGKEKIIQLPSVLSTCSTMKVRLVPFLR